MGNYKTSHCKVMLALIVLSICLAAGQKQSNIIAGEGLSCFVNYNRGIDTSPFEASKLSLGDKLVHSQEGHTKENDLITNLPGQPIVGFNQYGGYVTVDEQAGRALYYYFVEAHHSANTLPLLLWLNGGPGCSSLGYGAMQELGPFRVLSDGKTLTKNKFAWNYAANVLFLESPAGVGFSYSNTTSDVVSGSDKKTARDNYVFLLNWLDRFPEYKTRDFYMAGESYAGHYVPQLAHTILRQNNRNNKTVINLQGIIIGNAVINSETDTKGQFEYWGSHDLISDVVARQALKYCNFSPNAGNNQSEKCIEAVSRTDKKYIGNINVYNIFAPLCSNHNLTDKPNNISGITYDPCSENYVQAYMNTPDVQKALHVTADIPYQLCSDVLFKKWMWQDSPFSVIPLLKEIMTRGLRVWIYSGDVDGVVPVTSTQRSIEKMKSAKSIITPWYPWYIAGQVGGYAQVYENLTFSTVRGAGHEVPMYQSQRALSLIMHFLAGTPLPPT